MSFYINDVNINDFEIFKTQSIKEALSIIERSPHKIGIVVDENKKIIGSITDGDIRRGLISGKIVTQSVSEVMNPHPTIAIVGEDIKPYLASLKSNIYAQVIVANIDGTLNDIISLGDLFKFDQTSGIAVIMAGGKGKRLLPITKNIPKPMVEIGGKPVLEHLIKQLADQGFKKIILTVHYKKEIIQSYFKDGSDFDVSIEYVEEKEPLGTAGSLSLLPKWIDRTFVLLNADLMTSASFFMLNHYHEISENLLTVCVREYTHQVPFGVVEMDENNSITNIAEKPIYQALVNTGIYALSPEALKYIPYNSYLDMPDLISILKDKGKVVAFSTHESWNDVGRLEDLELARSLHLKSKS